MSVVVLDYQYPGAMSLQEDDRDDPVEDGNDPHKRSERKRQREKQRRSDLSHAFDELNAFIAEIDPEAGALAADNKKKRKKSGETEDASGITRLDLVGRAVKIMKRLHRENEERKRIISGMQDRGVSNNDNVLVMVPTLAPMAEEAYPVARASYPGSHATHPSAYYQSAASLYHAPPEYAVGIPGSRTSQYAPSQWGRYVAQAHQGHPPSAMAPIYRGHPSHSPSAGPPDMAAARDRRPL